MIRLNKFALVLTGFSLLVLTGCNAQVKLSNGNPALDALSLPEFLVEHVPSRDYWPTYGWERHTLQNSTGEALFGNTSAQISRDLPFVYSFIVVKDGYIVYEDYFNGQQAEDLQNVQSVAKSITSLLVGIGLDRGELPSLDITMGEIMPQVFANDQTTISPDITIRDALMMRSGLNYDPLNIADRFDSLEAYQAHVDTVLQEPLINSLVVVPQLAEPGTLWHYNTGDTQLVSEMFQTVVGQSLTDYGEQYLFSQMGINDVIWREDASGTTVGGGFLWMRTEDMAKIGFLMLNAGTWDGSQIVSKAWVQASIEPQGEGFNSETQKVEPISQYGYQWWLWGPGSFGLPHGGFQAVGYGGQIILVLPDIDTVIVATSDSLVSSPVASEQQNTLTNFIDQYVITKVNGKR